MAAYSGPATDFDRTMTQGPDDGNLSPCDVRTIGAAARRSLPVMKR
jgi:hypothetical protein